MLNGKEEAKSTVTAEEELTEERFLKEYKKKEYPKPSLTADIVVFRRTDEGVCVLLVRRGKHPYQGCWALPGGFVGPDEDVIDAARRELEEETGVADVPVEPFGVYGAPGRDPRGWTVSGGFCALLEGDGDVRAGDDAADARWCTVALAACEAVPATGEQAAQDAPDALYAITVTCGPEEALAARFEIVQQRFGSPRARVTEADGFAFDHAQILADAYLKVVGCGEAQ